MFLPASKSDTDTLRCGISNFQYVKFGHYFGNPLQHNKQRMVILCIVYAQNATRQ